MRDKYLWIYVTDDEYELPLVVADSATQLSLKLGLEEHSVMSMVSRAKREGYESRYKKVPYEEDDI